MKQSEAHAAVVFRHWLKAKKLPFSCVFEIKDTRGRDRFPFDEFKEEQEDFAKAIKHGEGVLLRNQGGGGEPDYTYHYKEPAFIVIKYPEGFEIISIDNFITEKNKCNTKSLSYARAKEISTYSIRGKQLPISF